jgi:HSP20 family protein
MSEEKKIQVKSDDSSGEKKPKGIHKLSAQQRNPFPLSQDLGDFFDSIPRFEELFWRPLRRADRRSIEDRGEDFRTPLSNVKETDEEFEISSEMPGLDKEDIEVMVHDGLLEIRGEVEEEKKEEREGELVRSEYRASGYYRCFDLPQNVDEENIDAKLDKGILKVNIPKKELESVDKRKIEVK